MLKIANIQEMVKKKKLGKFLINILSRLMISADLYQAISPISIVPTIAIIRNQIKTRKTDFSFFKETFLCKWILDYYIKLFWEREGGKHGKRLSRKT